MSEVLLAVCTGRLTVVVRVHSLRKAVEDKEHPNHHAKELLSDTKMRQKHYVYKRPLICESVMIPFNYCSNHETTRQIYIFVFSTLLAICRKRLLLLLYFPKRTTTSKLNTYLFPTWQLSAYFILFSGRLQLCVRRRR